VRIILGIIGILIGLLVVVLILGSVLYQNVPKELKSCHDTFNLESENLLTDVNNGKLTDVEKCRVWKNNLDSLDACIANVTNRSGFPRGIVEIFSKTQQLKAIQERACQGT
jgi:hypothetical protein